MTTPDDELARLRARMDEVNRRLCTVLHERARLCRAIGAHKRAHALPAADPAREQAMLAQLLAIADDGFARDELAPILRAVFAASRAVVERAARH